MSDLSDKTVLVTGSSRGIGAATVKCLSEAGAFVIAHYNSDREGAKASDISVLLNNYMEKELLKIRGVTRSHPDIDGWRMEMTRFGLGQLYEDTGVSVVDVDFVQECAPKEVDPNHWTNRTAGR